MARTNDERRGNPFLSKDMDDIHNATNAGHKVFQVWAGTHIEVEEISGGCIILSSKEILNNSNTFKNPNLI